MSTRIVQFCILLLATTLGGTWPAAPAHATAPIETLLEEGNYQEAFAQIEQILQAQQSSAASLAKAYPQALQCLHALNRLSEVDSLRAVLLEQHGQQWEVLAAVAKSWNSVPHHGYEIAGEFLRGNHRGGGKILDSRLRDRAQALQLYHRALERLQQTDSADKSRATYRLLDELASAVRYGDDDSQAWRLQALTSLSELPAYQEGWGYASSLGAPVDADGKPIFYTVPVRWEAATSDGQRWRWLLAEMERLDPSSQRTQRLRYARFLQSQFGVQTLAHHGGRWGQPEDQATRETGIFALHTLSENETIAKLATGIERFSLPDEHNPLKWFQRAEDFPQLAELFENRRQYVRAAAAWQQAIQQQPDQQQYQKRLQQITGNWGRFESVLAQPTGQGATVDFRFRNGKRVEFVAHEIKIHQLLDEVKRYLESDPEKLNWDQVQIENLGHRLVTQSHSQYLGPEVARWSLDLEPGDQHFDQVIPVTTPLQKSGAYLLTSQMANGNSTSVVLWLHDTALVKKPLREKSLYYVADAVTGQPVPDCQLEFFGYRQEHLGKNKYQVHTKQLSKTTDAEGLVEFSGSEEQRQYQWLTIATNDQGRFAYQGFSGIWSGQAHQQQYQQVKVFAITDRPVYRPEQQVEFKFWVRHAQYDLQAESQYAAQSFQIEIRDPKNEKVFSTQLISDAYGGLTGKWTLPAGATLGQYRLQVVNHGGGTFRVEEYKKPEFEVTLDAPSTPVPLGAQTVATIRAKYYFGAPVINGKVKYKILRTSFQHSWYPPMPWDWLYGPGYGWISPTQDWYPGWARWGCRAPSPSWFWHAPNPPEVVAEQEVELGPDGTVAVPIDTTAAQALYPDQDQRYQIEVEVVDASRRTLTARGQILVACQPFQVHLWTDRGYYTAGDTIVVGTAAHTLDAQPVVGTGKLRLLKIQYKEGQPVETEVGSWELATGETGQATLQIKASQTGQYRLSYTLTNQAGETLEGGQLLTVRGPGFDGSEFRFNDLELLPDQRTYRPGDQVALQINTNRSGAAVLLFARASGGIYGAPQLVQMEGKSTIVELDVTSGDMPNFFVEAVTVHGGKAHTVTRELFVPPSQQVLNVEVVPSAAAVLPGQAAQVLLKLTDEEGEPLVGSLALSIYDKALEYVSGGSNVANIREFFWKWRRHHQPQGETNLETTSQPLVAQDQPEMQAVGIFGDALDSIAHDRSDSRSRKEKSLATPMRASLASPLAATAAESPEASPGDLQGAAPGEAAHVAPQLREHFADTALWVGALETNSLGIAEVPVTLPENLTTWKIRAWGMGHGTRVGEGEAEIVTRKDLIVRLQAPRFFVEQDEVVLSANVHNYLPEAKQVTVQLELDSLLAPQSATATPLSQTIHIEAGGEQRVDWRVRVEHEGQTTLRVSALTDQESDAMQMRFPVHVHGMLQTESYSGVVQATESAQQFEINIPAQRRAEQTQLEVRYTPTLAGAMLDALPYLVDYPYGCTEQTLNRFVPAVLTQQTLRKLGVDLATFQRPPSDRDAATPAEPSREAWQRQATHLVLDEAELAKVVAAGVNRLTEMQLADGGWGWFSGWGEQSAPHTTAVVMHGLLMAKANGVKIDPNLLQRGTRWLQQYQAQQLRLLEQRSAAEGSPHKSHADNLDALVYLVLSEADSDSLPMREALYRDRKQLAIGSLATLGLALHQQGDQEKLTMVLRNLLQHVRQDGENQTAWLELPSDGWWVWYGGEFESHAFTLKLLAATQPDSPLASGMVKYLLNNRQHATSWKSTRDTALVVEAFADYLAASGEDKPEVTVEVWVDGQQRKAVTITRENLFAFDNRLVVPGEQLAAGRHTVEIRKQGKSPIYFSGSLTNFTLEEQIEAAGLELKVERRYYRLTPADTTTAVPGGRGQVVDQQTEKVVRQPLEIGAALSSGDLVEVELVVQSKNDYEYLLLEDRKAAGMEPVAVQSGYNDLGAYVEYRDDRVSLFLTRLARGKHSFSYRLRAEIPGKFSALPTQVSALYAPELKANSAERKLRIVD